MECFLRSGFCIFCLASTEIWTEWPCSFSEFLFWFTLNVFLTFISLSLFFFSFSHSFLLQYFFFNFHFPISTANNSSHREKLLVFWERKRELEIRLCWFWFFDTINLSTKVWQFLICKFSKFMYWKLSN